MENDSGEQLVISAMQGRSSFVLVASWPRQNSPVLGEATHTVIVVYCHPKPAESQRQLPSHKAHNIFLSSHVQEDRNRPRLSGSNGHLKGESSTAFMPINVIQ